MLKTQNARVYSIYLSPVPAKQSQRDNVLPVPVCVVVKMAASHQQITSEYTKIQTILQILSQTFTR